MRRPARIAARIAVFALIGAAVTVLVAWWCTLATTPAAHDHALSRLVRPRQWPTSRDWTAPPIHVWVERARGRQRVTAFGWDDTPPANTLLQYVDDFGFPCTALRMTITGARGRSQQTAITLPRPLWINNSPNSLPYIPLWPGFALDTAFYGGLAFLLWTAPGFVRRGVRRRRGRCVRCGYELKGLGVCPECGGGA